MHVPLLPFWTVRIPLRDPARFIARLMPLVAPTPSYIKAVRDRYPFVGAVTPSKLRLLSVEKGRNTYVPWVLGRILTPPEGSFVNVTLTLHPFALFLLRVFVDSCGWISASKEREACR